MKKIGILTYYSVCNFGANLQALSTYYYFKNRGYNVIFINWIPDTLENYYKNIIPVIQIHEHERFVNNYLIQTRRCKTDKDIVNVIIEEKIDAIIVGSDAVLQHHPLLSRIHFSTKTIVYIASIGQDRCAPNPFWGSFIDNLPYRIPICMMSGSSQNSSYKLSNPKERPMLKKLLEQFSYISTRDDWTSKMVAYYTNNEIIPDITPDPVFAFNYNFKDLPSREEILIKYNLPNNYVLLSFHNSSIVSDLWLASFEAELLKYNVSCVAFPFPQGITYTNKLQYKIDLPLSPIDWYSLIRYSSGYIGNNMHPIVVCLHNSIPCFSFDNYGIIKWKLFVNEKSSKIYHIMKTFGVLDYRVSCLRHKSKFPSPETVVAFLRRFPIQRVSETAAEYLLKYKEMMAKIEKAIL